MRRAKYYDNEESFEAVFFHAWGQAGDENGAYPVAIIERADGQVLVVDADRVRFSVIIHDHDGPLLKAQADRQELLAALEKIANMDVGMNHHDNVIAKIMRETARDAITKAKAAPDAAKEG